MSTPFTTKELVEALIRLWRQAKPRTRVSLTCKKCCNQVAMSVLCQYMSSSLERCKITKTWRKAAVIALPKPNKPKDNPKSYRLISLLCMPLSCLKGWSMDVSTPSLIPKLPHGQAGFRKGRSTVDQVALLTQDIEYCLRPKRQLALS